MQIERNLNDDERPPTVVDVARIAGVALGTVSRVLNNPDSVGAESRARVEKVIEDLGYTPLRRRKGGRHMHRPPQRKGVVGVVVVGLAESLAQASVFSDALRGIEEDLATANEHLMLASVPRADRVPSFLSNDLVDGVIVRVPFTEDWRNQTNHELLGAIESRPHVWLAGQPAGVRGDAVECDFDAVGRIAVEYLWQFGHRNAACLVPRKGSLTVATPQETFAVYGRRRRMEVDRWERPSGSSGPWPVNPAASAEMFEGFVDRWVQLPAGRRPTVLILGTDTSAAPLYAALRAKGLRVGADVSVLSLCRDPISTAGIEPGVTSIENFGETIGRRAVQQLRWRLQHPEENPYARLRVEPAIHEAESVANLSRSNGSA